MLFGINKLVSGIFCVVVCLFLPNSCENGRNENIVLQLNPLEVTVNNKLVRRFSGIDSLIDWIGSQEASETNRSQNRQTLHGYWNLRLSNEVKAR